MSLAGTGYFLKGKSNLSHTGLSGRVVSRIISLTYKTLFHIFNPRKSKFLSSKTGFWSHVGSRAVKHVIGGADAHGIGTKDENPRRPDQFLFQEKKP
jgi:hypothetical protein